MLDPNKHVQEAACSALATLEEQAGPELLPRLKVGSNLIRDALRSPHKVSTVLTSRGGASCSELLPRLRCTFSSTNREQCTNGKDLILHARPRLRTKPQGLWALQAADVA